MPSLPGKTPVPDWSMALFCGEEVGHRSDHAFSLCAGVSIELVRGSYLVECVSIGFVHGISPCLPRRQRLSGPDLADSAHRATSTAHSLLWLPVLWSRSECPCRRRRYRITRHKNVDHTKGLYSPVGCAAAVTLQDAGRSYAG